MNINQLANVLSVCAGVFDLNERFSLADSVIAKAVERLDGNTALESVLPKIILINSFYGTQIYSTEIVARHIVTLDTDQRLKAGDLSLVDDIRHGLKLKKSGKEIDLYSFATKYCALHELMRFPMFDTLVKRLLWTLNRELSFHASFTQTSLRDYVTYVSVVDSLMTATGLESYKYKRLDQGLWIYSKYLWQQVNLSESEIAIIRQACEDR